MPISIACPCGKSAKVKDELAGKRVRCPSCGDTLTIPPRPPVPPKVSEEDAAYQLLMSEPDPEPTPPRYVASGRSETGIQERPMPFAGDPVSLPPPPKPPKRKKVDYDDIELEPRHRRRGVAFEEGWFGGLNAGIIGGLLTMGLAAVWFFGVWFLGLWPLGRFVAYPIVLFVFGAIAFIKGLFGDES